MNIVNSNMSTNTQATTQIYTGLVINVQSAKGITLQKIYLRYSSQNTKISYNVWEFFAVRSTIWVLVILTLRYNQ